MALLITGHKYLTIQMTLVDLCTGSDGLYRLALLWLLLAKIGIVDNTVIEFRALYENILITLITSARRSC